MRIAIDMRFLQEETVGRYHSFLQQLFLKLVEQQSDNQFIFLFNQPLKHAIAFPENAQVVVVRSKITNYLQLRLWFDFQLLKALKRLQADIFISSEALSLRTKISQLLIVAEDIDASLTSSSFVKKYYFRKQVARARVIAVSSEAFTDEIVKKYQTDAERFSNIGVAAANDIEPLEWEDRELVKEQYAQGCEYFLFTGGVDPAADLLSLLKAFSLFKTRQRTSVKLLVTGTLEPDTKKTLNKLKTYKLRNEVIVHGQVANEEFRRLLAGAYALIYPLSTEEGGICLLEAFKSEVPVVASDAKTLREVGGAGALYVNPSNVEQMAEQLKIIFKDEQLRSELIQAGKVQTSKFNMSASVEKLWHAIERSIST